MMRRQNDLPKEGEQSADEGQHSGDEEQWDHSRQIEAEKGTDKEGGHRQTHAERTQNTEGNGSIDQAGVAEATTAKRNAATRKVRLLLVRSMCDLCPRRIHARIVLLHYDVIDQ
jgi:hypothetical protein